VVLTKLHAGGKFDASNYKVSGGLHGVGVSCVNALAEQFEVEVWRDGHTYEQEYSKGAPTTELKQTGSSKKRGTKIHFLPDRSIFTVTEYNTTRWRSGCGNCLPEQGAGDHADGRAHGGREDGEAKRRSSSYAGGIAEFIKHLNKGKAVLHDKPIYIESEKEAVVMEIALQYNDGYSENVFSFANNINTVMAVRICRGSARADAHGERGGAIAGTVQGREGEPFGRRCARGIGRLCEREAAAAAVSKGRPRAS